MPNSSSIKTINKHIYSYRINIFLNNSNRITPVFHICWKLNVLLQIYSHRIQQPVSNKNLFSPN